MTPEQVIKFYGSEEDAARILGLTRQAVNYWVNRKAEPEDRIPIKTQAWIQMLSQGKLKAKRNGK